MLDRTSDCIVDVRELRVAVGVIRSLLVFWLACRQYPSRFSSRSTVRSLTSYPRSPNARASFAALLDVQRNGGQDHRVSAAPQDAQAPSRSPGWVSETGLLPAPRRRTPPSSSTSPDSSSRTPRRIVSSCSPVVRATARIPPHPCERASAAAHNRRWRSFSTPPSYNNR